MSVIPEGFNVRSRVHEYGGGAYALVGEQAVFCQYLDQRLYRTSPNQPPAALTPEAMGTLSWRFADMQPSPNREFLICVMETHQTEREVLNELVALNLNGSSQPRVLQTGRDFYSTPRFSPDGKVLAWLAWDHPNMPWDGTELWVGDLVNGPRLENIRKVAGGSRESIFQPEWSPSGDLYYVSDKDNWWNIYQLEETRAKPVLQMEAEFGSPQWVFGFSQYVFLDEDLLAVILREKGFEKLALLNLKASSLTHILPEFTSFSPPSLGYDQTQKRLIFIAGSADRASAIYTYQIEKQKLEMVRPSREEIPDPKYISLPEAIQFETSQEAIAHALYYPPKNDDFQGPPDQSPPLIVIIHGGPTSQARVQFRPEIQFWTSRGFGLVDVNYRGSTGYGRKYREELYGQWGIVDVEDCIHAARYLADQDRVDPAALIIRGSSAGGFTTLSALVFHKVFRTGASYYGVTDLEALTQDTHKFESRYLDQLVGPYPGKRQRYHDRSPIHFLTNLSSPLLLFQGEADPVVPSSQAEMLVASLDENLQTYAYISFPDEAHGFRKAETIEKALHAELNFYSQILGFEPGEPLEPIAIQNFK
jgi:dipeptidyl aminopeptidase/acylaminoacyl peptidase